MSPKPRKWKRLSAGIYQTTYGIRVVMNCAAGRAEEWFELGTPLELMKKRRNEMKVELEAAHPELRAGARGKRTFAAAVKKHVATLTIASRASRLSELRAFAEVWGPKKIHRLTRDDGKRIVKLWHDAGVAPKTIRNRRISLIALYHDLYGAAAPTPLDGVHLPVIVKTRPTDVSVTTIRAVEAQLRAQCAHGLKARQTHARYLVLTASGCRPVSLMRAVPADVDLTRKVWNIPGAKGGEPIPYPLNPDLVCAFRYFIAAEAWGPYDTSEHARALRAAGWPAGVRPYNAKHAVGMDLGRKGIDAETIRALYGHTDVQTTRIYTGVVDEQLERASQALDGRLGWATVLEHGVGRQPENQPNLHIVKGLAGTAE